MIKLFSWVRVSCAGSCRPIAADWHTRASLCYGTTSVTLDCGLSALEYFGNDAALMARGPKGIVLVNAVGGVDVASSRRDVFDRFFNRGFSFASVIHPSAIVAANTVFGEGAQIMAGAVVQPGATIGRDFIINTRAVVDHDVFVDSHVHVATGAVIAGGVTIGEASHIGAGAVVI